jgi:hypothetical protein
MPDAHDINDRLERLAEAGPSKSYYSAGACINDAGQGS